MSAFTAAIVLLLPLASPQVEDEVGEVTVGAATLLSQREPVIGHLDWSFDGHFGLVGSGLSQNTVDVRFGLFDKLELRTSFNPLPSSLMVRFQLGETGSPLGATVFEGGLEDIDYGFRLPPPESGIAPSFFLEFAVSHARSLTSELGLFGDLRWRQRLATATDEDPQDIAAASLSITWDVFEGAALTAGVGVAAVVNGTLSEAPVLMMEVGRPGFAHYLSAEDGQAQSVTLPAALTFIVNESFDIDVFATPRIAPEPAVVFGAGLRWRIGRTASKKTIVLEES